MKRTDYTLLHTATEEEEDDVEESVLDLALQKTVSRVSALQVDRPRGELVLVAVELLALLGEVAINLTALVTRAWGKHAMVPAASGLAAWSYIFVLAALRFIFSASKRYSFPKLWNHTAFLYALQWIFTVLIFRSEIIHPRSKHAQGLTIGGFALSTLLLGIALTTRKGNKAVVLEREGDIPPSKEPLASLFSIATFGWVDAIVWQGYKKTLEISDVWNLNLKDKAAFVIADFQQTKKTSKLALRLLKYFKRMLLIQGLWCIFSNLFTFVPTVLLKAILEYVEDPDATPANAAWFYVTLLFFAGAIQAVADGQALWIGRKICIRLRAIIIGELYAKALKRKAAATADSVLGEGEKEKKKSDEQASKKPKSLRRTLTRTLTFRKKADQVKPKKGKTIADQQPDVQANVGTIINLMSVDSFKVSEISAYLHFLWASVPVQVIIAVTLLYRILGYSSIAGVLLMLAVLPINYILAKAFSRTQKKIMAATDARIHTTNEVLQNIRIIKYFAWEARFQQIVDEKRRAELKALRNRYIVWALSAMVWYGLPLLITFASFWIYTVVEGKRLVPSIAFTALSLFTLLRVPLDQLADMIAHVQESKVSVDRIEEFLSEEETEKYDQLYKPDAGSDGRIGLRNATLTWGSKNPNDKSSNEAFRLINVDVSFHVGELNIIAGPTGSGKTSLLMALLGEMKLLEGNVFLPGGYNREDLAADPDTGLTESVAYCAQQAWLVNDTIRENIIFASPLDEARYKAVISACALERDLEILGEGENTLVGEKGITLSGGQKQRISLARAMYCNARHVLLDDCLSAVDSHTAKHIFEQCIMGPLMYNRTCILVTHNVALTVPHAQHVIVLENGKVVSQGAPDDLSASGVFGEDLMKSRPGSRGNSKIPSRVSSDLEEVVKSNGHTGNVNGKANGDANGKSKPPKKSDANTRVEGKAEGRVKWSTIKMYLSNMGPWFYWIAAFSSFALQQGGSVLSNVWIRQWANSYQTSDLHAQENTRYTSAASYLRGPSVFVTSAFSGRTQSWNVPQMSSSRESYDMAPKQIPEVNAQYYLGIYALICVTYLAICLTREAVLFWGSLTASWKIHNQLLKSVMRAKFLFFDSTPLGQLMNRFSKDLEAVDQEVAPVAVGMIHSLFSVITVVILITIITPAFLIAGVFISAIYFAIGLFYIHSSRDLKRMESVQRSPLYQQFGETLGGIVTIRAYGDEQRFIRDNQNRVNTQSRPFIYLWATNRWLALRVDVAGALVSFFTGAFVLLSIGKIDAGAAGLALTYAVTFTENVLWLVRLYSSNEQNMNSVERVKEYTEVEQEARDIIPETRPPGNWPSQGSVEFINYTTRYRSDLDPVLKNLTFSVRPAEKVGIVGRTGAGKSSLALALFRGLEAEDGKILVDGIDIGLIGLQDLRESITMVPQDPTLFTGTIRSNLDPFGIFTDEEIFTALRRVHLISSPGAETGTAPGTPTVATTFDNPQNAADDANGAAITRISTNGPKENKNIFRNLESPVTESGSNLSQGQRQLLCLARALLKSPRVLLMDEATASIDYATDANIQETLRELKDSTIITIAHRLQTIIDYDKVLVLDKGEVIEYDGPYELLRKEGGIFRGMCDMSGDLETLEGLAKKAWESRRLVDDS